ncbi:hypothetical protein SAMN04487947_3525 [Halogeometricum rufum]|uniref:ChsH2 C-terminal OB-fold domain-containing protein n=1 Tax=Halogeometricum rufum TaxID=553469 RepID=A0A1I6IQD4_9EURY|nr:OB-fold domain-containing protein [Halogeometricum rufum]SFR68926.1 hypothetical protein SAMN04487947_3525 [Halogeometricum rufum]
MTADASREAGGAKSVDHETWLDAVASGDGFSLVCPEGHGWLPPRRVCKTCGSTTLERMPLPASGTVETYTEITVPAPRFSHEDAVAVAIADFGTVRVTGRLRGVEYDDVERGTAVEPGVERSGQEDERIVVLRPR